MKNKQSYAPEEVEIFMRAYGRLVELANKYGKSDLDRISTIRARKLSEIERAIDSYERIVPENIRERQADEIEELKGSILIEKEKIAEESPWIHQKS